MSSMKFLHGLCIFYIVSLLSCPLVFAEVCSFSSAGIEGVEVIQLGDRQIYTLFTGHLFGQPDTVAGIWIEGDRGENTIAAFNQLLGDHEERIVSEQSDVRKITELVRSGSVDWIGVEHDRTDTSYVDDATDRYVTARNNLNTRLNQSPRWSSNKTDQLLFLVFSNFMIARATHPEAFHGVEIYPLEDEDLKRQTDDNVRQDIYWRESIQNDTDVTDAQYSAILSFQNDIGASNLPISERELERFLDEIGLPESSTQAYVSIRKLIRAYNNVISLIPQRDAAVVQSILDLPDNGLILFGPLHGPGIKQGLITACQNENSSILDRLIRRLGLK